MKILDRYIAKTILAAIALVTLLLAGLQIFILFVSQLSDIGKADYGVLQAFQFVLLQMPYQVYLFFPMASLLGCLIGLGVLANNHELVVMRAAGMSVGQVTLAVLKAALLVIVVITATGETLVPKLAQLANDQKIEDLSDEQTLRTARGVWLRYDNDFITIGTIMPENILQQVYQFHFDSSHHLRFSRKIEQINYEQGKWILHGVDETVIDAAQTKLRHVDTLQWELALNPNILSIAMREPDEMSLAELRQYVQAQVKSQRLMLQYQRAYWQRLVQPLSTMVMMILSIPFIFGPLRSSTMGSKLLIGAAVGFGFHMLNRFFGPLSQVFQWPPVLAALTPTLLFALIGFYLMRRVK
jgi:lipopolysaccharide export system permease protein